MQINIYKDLRFKPVQILVIGFAVVILMGAILLTLPIASNEDVRTPFVDALFTSTSAVCVTGLVTLDTGTYWSYFGKTVILILIQIGGLGFMSFATLISLLLGKKITLKERLVMQEAMNTCSLQGLVKLARYVLLFTFTIEGIGALILSIIFIPEHGLIKGIYFSIFHSVSAFCNAGFDLMGEFRSLTPYAENPIIILTIATLIVIGGLGFAVWYEIFNYRKVKKITLHSKFVIVVTAILIVVGAILMFIFEYNNPATINPMSVKGKILSSLFASITPRTAGFNSISTTDMTPAGRFLTIILMFIGGSPGSTAGGIKTATAGILIMTVISIIKGREETEVFERRISKETIYKSLAIAVIGITLVVTVSMILTITEAGTSLEYIIYEATSAFGTVGLTLGLTTKLSIIGKTIIIFTMYCGRVGPLTIALALSRKHSNNTIRYPEDKILVG
ncbi:TrkH family potassium uptake protein [Clostridium sp. SYSU_GA19001]|uniref:TrkH family potassium uptake protein n=1 Tax=Clostridium caldaquaticum TaxID=2940653 RepID=UPI0020775900|nr:TrkH family potassium uptake protein [Clostridium caldaquaticum]MCM8711974.1 TrkH family potassium uptake protein [Clostridium caldaquaticum]